MITKNVNIFDLTSAEADAICIPTNGYVNKIGCGIMGAGVARELLHRKPDAPKILGSHLLQHGNVPGILYDDNPAIVSFPTKPAYVNTRALLPRYRPPRIIHKIAARGYPGWAGYSDLYLIEGSAKLLVEMTDKRGWQRVFLPMPGVGNGNLDWRRVKDVLSKHLDTRFTICYITRSNHGERTDIPDRYSDPG